MEQLNRPVTPPLNELRQVFKNPRLLKAFQDLFDAVPSDINLANSEIENNIASADSKAGLAVDLVEGLSAIVDLLELRPVDVATETEDSLEPSPIDQADTDDLSPALIDIEGATGTFTTSDPYTVTVVNGIITDIS